MFAVVTHILKKVPLKSIADNALNSFNYYYVVTVYNIV